MKRRIQKVALAEIIRDSLVQPREAINMTTVSEYALAMAKAPVYQGAGLAVEAFPPVVVFHEQDDAERDLYWLADGWHRVLAAEEAGFDSLPAEVREGGIHDAIMYAAGANAAHGLRRTSRDKHRAVRMLLDHPTVIREEWSNVRIMHATGVSDFLVRAVRREREEELGLPPSTTRRGQDGKLYSLQLRSAKAQDDTVTVDTPEGEKTSQESFSGDSEPFLYQCETDGCDAVTTEQTWHCGDCGAHLPLRDYPVGAECPVCVGDPQAEPMPVLARIEDVATPKAERNGTTQAPYTPGRLKPESALLAYERLRAALEIIDSLNGVDVQQVVEQAPDFDQFAAQLRRARTTLDWMQASLRMAEAGRR